MKINDLFIEDTKDLNWSFVESLDPVRLMFGKPHSKKWHKEGDPWQHTKMAVRMMEHYINYMNMVSNGQYDINHSRLLLAAALCHDLGKPSTTYFDESDNEYHCKAHGLAAEPIVREMFADEEELLVEALVWLVKYHMDFHSILMKSNPFKVLDKLQGKIVEKGIGKYVTLYDMYALNAADSAGSINSEDIMPRLAKIKKLITEYYIYE